MLWILMAILGVPIWLVVGGLTATLLNRRRFKRSPDVFPMKLRLVSGDFKYAKEKWPRPTNYGRWVHDVLLMNKGLGLVPTIAIGVKDLTESEQKADTEAVKGLGENPVIFLLELDDGAHVQFAVPAEAIELARGPFIKQSQLEGKNQQEPVQLQEA